MFKKLIGIMVVTMLVACGAKVEVPPTYVGKVLTKDGYATETIPPSKFRLPACMAYCDKLVLLEVNDSSLKESMAIFMPKDKLNLTVEIRGTFSIANDSKTTNAIFDRVTSRSFTGESGSRGSVIDSSTVYDTYGRQAVRGIVRSTITQHSIQDVMENRESIGAEIHAAITKKLKDTSTPILISRFELADLQPPEVIVKGQIKAKEREIMIQTTEASAQIEILQAIKDLEIAKKNRLVEKEKAYAIAEQNRIAAKSITPQVMEYKRLEAAIQIYTALANSDNTIIVPMDSSSFSSAISASDAAVAAKVLKKGM